MKNKGFNLLLFAMTISVLLTTSCGHSDTADQKPAFVITSDEIVQAFLDDEKAANAKYNDLIIQVSGPVMELNKIDGEVTGIKLSSDEFNIVNCTFQYPVEEATLEGGVITVKGICSGFLGDASSMLPGGTVEIKRASIVGN
ncbi:MAG: hypothetical protein WEC59_04700 [Salibacteraceae bacterium]